MLCTKKAKDTFEQVEKVVWSLAAKVYSHSWALSSKCWLTVVSRPWSVDQKPLTSTLFLWIWCRWSRSLRNYNLCKLKSQFLKPHFFFNWKKCLFNDVGKYKTGKSRMQNFPILSPSIPSYLPFFPLSFSPLSFSLIYDRKVTYAKMDYFCKQRKINILKRFKLHYS